MNQGSHGIGLSVCMKIATALGGSIGVDSTYGEGSTFTLRISAKLVNS